MKKYIALLAGIVVLTACTASLNPESAKEKEPITEMLYGVSTGEYLDGTVWELSVTSTKGTEDKEFFRYLFFETPGTVKCFYGRPVPVSYITDQGEKIRRFSEIYESAYTIEGDNIILENLELATWGRIRKTNVKEAWVALEQTKGSYDIAVETKVSQMFDETVAVMTKSGTIEPGQLDELYGEIVIAPGVTEWGNGDTTDFLW